MPEVINGLWLCSWEETKMLVPMLPNPFVVNCTKDIGYLTKNTIRVPVDDNQIDVSLLTGYIFEVCKIINDHLLAGYPVVVHCSPFRFHEMKYFQHFIF